MRIYLGLMALAALLWATGCEHRPVFQDDEGGELKPSEERLSLPYARGTRIALHIAGVTNHASWKITSDTPTVFQIESNTFDNDRLEAIGYAVADGSSVIRLVDGTSELLSETVTVKSATSARLYEHGQVRILGRDQAALEASQISKATVLTGGKGVFAVAYFAGAERVYGHGIAETSGSTGLVVSNETTGGVAANEWLFVTPTSDGAQLLSVAQGATTLANLPITAVPQSSVTTLGLVEESLTGRHDDDEIWLLLKATNAAGDAVLGVYGDWTLDGMAQQNTDSKIVPGDLYRYRLKRSQSKTVVATVGALTATRTIKASEGHVYDTTYLGCSASGTPATSGAMLALVIAALGLASRTRRAV